MSALLRVGWYIHAQCQSLWVPPILGVLPEVRPEPSAYVNAFLTCHTQSYAVCAVLHPADTQRLSTLMVRSSHTALQLSTSVTTGKLGVSLGFPRKAVCSEPVSAGRGCLCPLLTPVPCCRSPPSSGASWTRCWCGSPRREPQHRNC